MTLVDRAVVESWYRRLQERLCADLAAADGTAVFGHDTWERPGGGGGLTRILSGGDRLEKAAVNFSAVWGDTPPGLGERLASESHRFYAAGVSVIVHPRNPHAPTLHCNLRYFETDSGVAWFGGGADLTPYYLYEEDARHFHRVLRGVCDRHAVADYAAWKQDCDLYFRLPHRGEARGVGGIFFDHLENEEVWAFQQDLGDSIPDAYLPILGKRMDTPYGEREKAWHELRRGRYVEFNLVWDRGTRFGLETSGRTESILASLPPRARWENAHRPESGSPEERLLTLLEGEPLSWA